jgi:hypothetical protein
VNELVAALGVACALGAAAYSTWSPCGQSMLSQITPMGERSRGFRFGFTAAWFVAGAVIGGAMLGGFMALLAVLASAIGLTATVAAGIAAVVAIAGAASDAHVFGFGPPFLLRQVNETWLGKYRSWLYGLGFGWQIGTGITTYIMTTAVLVTVALGALTASPLAALALGALFGFARGIAVLLGARITSPAALADFHRRFDALGPTVRRAVVAVQVAIAITAAWAAGGPIAAGAVALLAVAAALIRAPWLRTDAGRTAPARTLHGSVEPARH